MSRLLGTAGRRWQNFSLNRRVQRTIAARAIAARANAARAIAVGVDFDSVADELYSLSPAEFTVARNAREKEAKAAGDSGLAAAIHQLGKPSMAAWLANQLVRKHPDEMRPLLELGAGLREATASLSGDQLRQLSRQRHRLVYGLVQQAKRLANAGGHQVSDDTARRLEDTLFAVLADETAAGQLIGGRLTDALEHTGFSPGTAEPSKRQAGKQPPKGSAGKETQRAKPAVPAVSAVSADQRRPAAELERAERDEAQAEAATEHAGAALKQAQAGTDQAEQSVSNAVAEVDRLRAELGRLRDELDRLRDELDRATSEQSRAERDQRRARSTLEKAERSARESAGRLRDATARREQLSS
jgi:hypothetical protein